MSSGSEVLYRPTGTRATATRLRWPREVGTVAGPVRGRRGDWLVVDEFGVSVWPDEEFREAFEEAEDDAGSD